MKVLVACEESQTVTMELRKLGHEAYSCDIEPCSGGYLQYHIQDDCLKYINGSGEVTPDFESLFETQDGSLHPMPKRWDMIIAHPPCTYLTLAGNKWLKPEFKDRFPEREKQREDAVKFFMDIWNADCDKVAIENPVGIMSSRFRPPDQYIEPYMFGDAEKKKTGLWLRGLPKLVPTKIVEPVIVHCKSGANEPRWHMETMKLPAKERSKARSKTFKGIAEAIAMQWAGDNGFNFEI